MSSAEDLSAMPPSDREIVSARRFAVRRALLFKAWTDPQHLQRWWGPNGFTNTFQEFDPRPGGHWRFVMHGPDGKDYKNHSVFIEVSPARIVIDHISGPKFQITATFAEEAGKTQLTFRMLFPTAADCERAKVYAVAANEQNFDRLEVVLAAMS